ncbi:MAG: DNA repair protein RecN [Gemmatimonadota bacterium]|nr:DNA repair protein RecN [Gemmatimonadota bacterium]
MLRELRIRNFAVIEELRVELGPGLTVLSGETGAGKSIIVGALSLLLGERASADLIRGGEERAVVEGTFDVPADEEWRARCDEAGLDLSEGWILLRREVQREGRNRAWVNGTPATAGLVGELGGALVDLHGQHEHQALLRRGPQRRILDAWAGAEAAAARVREAWEARRDAADALERERRRGAERRARAEVLAPRAAELEGLRVGDGEVERLEASIRRLEHSEELLGLSAGLYDAVYGSETSLVDRLGELRRALERLAAVDPDTAELGSLHESARVTLEELGRRLADYRASVEHDPARLASLRERHDLLLRAARKFGTAPAELAREARAARAELDALREADSAGAKLESDLADRTAELHAAAAALTVARTGAASRLEAEVGRLLPDLGFPDGRFVVWLGPLPEPGPDGAEAVEFLVGLNAGFDPAPLARVASGGELSRVMLALKTTLAEVDDVPCLVFDEIDAGIGGRVAHRVAGRLAAVAAGRQVFAITHLPQIAAAADRHLRVEKGERDGRAVTRLVPLEGEERVEEIARMLGGDPERDVSRRHARELLDAVAAGDDSGISSRAPRSGRGS